MSPILINTKVLKEEEIVSLKDEVLEIISEIDRRPKLVIVKATDDKACEAYIKNKVRFGEEVGIEVEVVEIPYGTSEQDVLIEIMALVSDENVDSVILQLPVYKYLDKDYLISAIPPEKDGDCFSIENLGRVLQGNGDILPCTPAGVLDILDNHLVKLEGSRVTIIGRSTHVGMSLGLLLTQKGAVTRITHSKSPSLEEDIRGADIVISCVGKKNLILPEWMKKGSVLLGVGIVFEDGKQYTDYDVDRMLSESKCSLVGDRVNCTGVTTVMNLIKNTIKLCKKNNSIIKKESNEENR